MRKNRSCNAVSEILATVLLLGIAVSLFSVLYVIVISSPVETPSPSVILVGSIKEQTITINHHGGVALDLDTEILAIVGGAWQNVTTARDYLDISYMSNNKWDIGEKLVIDVGDLVYPSIDVTDLQIEVMVVDVESNSILLTGVLREGEMISTVSLSTSVDAVNPYEVIFSPANITATGDSRLGNVTLWYRYSPDNLSWGSSASWWNDNWNHYHTITIDHTKVDENLVNFPVLVKINSTIGTKCDNGNSIRFIGTDNSTKYYYEIEEWNSSGDSYVWVNITSVSSTADTAFLMYYNNSGASDNQNPNNVWDTNYIGVWHLSEISGTHYDSTSNNHDSSTVVGVTQDATGKTDGGDNFDGSNDYIDITMNLPSTVTISAWAKSTAGTLVDMLWCIDSDNHGPDLFFYSGVISLNTWNGAGNPFCSIPSDVDEWHLYTTVIEPGNTNIYIDMQLGGSANYRNPAGSNFHISSSAGYDWQGSIDEVRVSKIARNSSWIKASFRNQNNSSSFLTIESEQSNSAGVNWTSYSTDTGSPWQWNFNFPNSTGYYEFYSMGKYNEGVEEAPGSADVICWYNPVSLNTSVDTIIPCEIVSSPANITATGDSRLDNVTLWYRYSTGNSSWWNSSWLKRKTINLNTSSGSTPSNYQVLLNITYDNDMNTNFSDLRFVNYSDNSTELDYWIESKRDGNWAQVWVEIGNSITTANKTHAWMYYGNSDAISTSNGNNTFLFFDNFNDNSINTSKWTKHKELGSISETGGYLECGGGSTSSPYRHTVLGSDNIYNTAGDNIAIEGKIQQSNNAIGEVSVRGNYAFNDGFKGRWDCRSGNEQCFMSPSYNGWGGFGSSVTRFGKDDGSWHTIELQVTGNTAYIYIDGAQKNSVSVSSYTETGEISLQNHYGSYTRYDNICVRKYVTAEPSLNSFGDEQSGGIDWTIFDVDNDSVNGWNWSFNFPNDAGYYEFYSIGKYNEGVEEVPGSADANCYYNLSALLATSVDAISPYETEDLPLNITATGDSRLDNVTLWYRYSTDNSSWWNDNWNCYRTITIDHDKIDENLVNFPVLVEIGYAIGSKCDDGDSIRFIGTDNSTEYHYEIEEWNSSGDSYVWVNITSVSSTADTAFLMYYNNSGTSDNQNPNNVWDTNYIGVWHLSESTGMHYDSTSNNHDSSNVVGVTQDATGMINGGDDLDGSNDYIDITMNLPSTVTISAWATYTGSADMLWCIDSDNHGPDLFYQSAGSGVICLNTWDSWNNPFCNMPTDADEWHLYTTVIEPGNTNIYIDMQLGGSANYRNPAGSNFHISSSAGYDWQGSIDEVRVSKIARNSSWIKASFRNQNNSSSFLTIESEQSNSAGVNWTSYSTDTSSPWQWNFNFPNSTGYYEFYSIGKYNERVEEVPKSADANCYYNASEEEGELSIWHFDENSGSIAYDSIGDYDGSVNGASWVTGVNGSALEFDGVNDYTKISDSENDFDFTGNFTVMCWVKENNAGGYSSSNQRWANIISKGGDSEWELQHNIGNQYFEFAVRTDQTRKYVTSTTALKNDVWYMYTGVYDGSHIKVYVNCTEEDSTNLAGTVNPTSYPVVVGKRMTSYSDRWFNGTIDEIYTYNRALTHSEICSHYNDTKPQASSEVGLISQWHLDENSGLVAYDSVDTNNGTIHGATWTTGVNGSALKFDGKNDYMDLPDGVSSELGGASATTGVAWVKRDTTGSRDIIIDLTIAATYSKVFIEFQADNTIRVGGRADSGDAFQSKITTSTITDTNWHHIVGILDIASDDILIYIDGVLQTTTGTPSWAQTTFDANVGAAHVIGIGAGLINAFNGIIDEVIIYDRALTAEEIKEHYDEYKPEDKGEIAVWHLDENTGSITYDSIGDNDGKIYGATWTTGVNGSALEFGGVNNCIQISDSETDFNFAGNFTVMCWVKENNAGGYSSSNQRWANIISKGGDSEWELQHNIGNQYFEFAVRTDQTRKYVTSTTALKNDVWYMYTGVYDGSHIKVYVNCTEEDSTNLAGTVNPTSYPVVVGKRMTSYSDRWFNGTIDEIYTYNRALTHSEICSHYNDTKPEGETNIASQWHLDENTGTTAYDSIGNNDGSVNGAGWVTGVNGSALSFDGSNDYVEISDSDDFNLGNTLSFEVWVYPQEQKTAKIVQKGDWNGHGLGQDKWKGWKGSIYINGDEQYGLDWGKGRPDLDTWYHLVLTYDGLCIRLFVNGTEVDNETVTGNLRVNSRNIFIGSDGGAQKFFNGITDEVTIYNRAISANEILNRYKTLKP